ncbi:MAG: aspartate/glutamate racemase family protein [Saprospiraceae bacterium]|nr:aspartate/glutamate racemase family protein [Pyrinomonadaceae bacterium]
MAKLGIVDWGIGGIGIYKLIKERRGGVPVLYFSDTGVTPYGKMTRQELVARLNTVMSFLKSQGVTHIVIGCNAASTAIPQLCPEGLILEGVIDSAVNATLRLKPKRLGLIGGRRTVMSGVYRMAFAKHGIMVSQRIAQPLSGLIESGDVLSEKLRAECKRILAPLENCSHILLACTHYPAIISVMKDFVSPETIFIDPAEQLFIQVLQWKVTAGGRDVFITTGDTKAMKMSALKAFSCDIPKPEKVSI